jgi:peptide-methionine (R)-S-oxide reductase
MKIYDAKTNQVKQVEPITKTDQQWRSQLTPEQFDITRRAGTEAAFSKTCTVPLGKDGIYQCVCCDTDLCRSLSLTPVGPAFFGRYQT